MFEIFILKAKKYNDIKILFHLLGGHRPKSVIKYGVWLRRGKRKHSYVARESNRGNFGKTWQFWSELHMHILLDLVIPLLGIRPTDKLIYWEIIYI